MCQIRRLSARTWRGKKPPISTFKLLMREFCENKLQVRCPKGDFWQYVGSPVNAKARVLEFFGMVRTAMIVALLALCTTPLSFGQAASVSDSVKLDALRQRAEQGDAKA